ncbi:MAG: ABC transporter ATP-binding protein [Clostridiales bacterium]|mgnify:FL=1|nr:ABC transporter ATP-binding protein [Clostridiales bacterium]
MIELKNICAGYEKNIVIKGLSTIFEKGKLISIIGVNGCGKSTLLKTIVGIIPSSSGEILIDGECLGNMTRTEVARKIAYLAQGKNTPDMTVEQLVLHGRFPYLNYPRRYSEKDRELAFSAMKKVGLAECVGKPLHTLSGGMRQNAYIAMALAQDTSYILLDEPTTYLDISHQLKLMKTLKELAESGKGIIAVMHDLPMAFDFSSEILLINNGSISMRSTPEEVCKFPVIETVFGISLRRSQDGKNYYYQWR